MTEDKIESNLKLIKEIEKHFLFSHLNEENQLTCVEHGDDTKMMFGDGLRLITGDMDDWDIGPGHHGHTGT